MSEGGNKRRPVRPSALKAQQTFLASANGYDQASSEDDGAGFEGRPARRNVANPRVDLYKLDTTSLQRYRKVYKLADAPANTTKEDLVPSIARHFAAQVLDEEDVLIKFIQAIQRHAGKQRPSAPVQPPPTGVPVVVKKIVKPAALPMPSTKPRR